MKKSGYLAEFAAGWQKSVEICPQDRFQRCPTTPTWALGVGSIIGKNVEALKQKNSLKNPDGFA